MEIEERVVTCQECDDARYIQKEGKYQPCVCLSKEKTRKRLGSFAGFTKLPKTSKLAEYLGKNILILGDRARVRQHIAKILLDDETLRCNTVPAQSLLDLNFNTKDGGQHRLLPLQKPQWSLIELGVSDVPNKYLPELMISLMSSRKVQGKTTWVYCARSKRDLKERYMGSSGENLYDFFAEYMDEEIQF